MNLLVVSQYFWPENFRINDLVSGILDRGHKVTVLTGIPNYPSGQIFDGYDWSGPYSEAFGGVKVVRVPMLPRGKGGGIRMFANYVSFAISGSIFGAIRCREHYDAILVYQPSPVTVGIPARFIGSLRSSPILFWVQDLWPESLSATGTISSSFILKLVEVMVRWIYRGTSLVLVQSEAFVSSIGRLGVPKTKIRYFPNTAEDFYRPLPKNQEWSGPVLPNGFRIMFAGSIGAAQSFETILAAAEILRDHKQIQWIVLGDGRLGHWVANEIERRNMQGFVHQMGRYPVESMPDWFSQSDVMLVTLRRDPIFSLTIPAKVQSYMACGKPIIAALEGEGARIVQDSGAGVAVSPDDPDALAKAILSVYNLPVVERDAMGRRGREYFVANFHREHLIDQLETWFREVKAVTQ